MVIKIDLMYRQKKTLAQLAFIFQKHEFLTKTVS